LRIGAFIIKLGMKLIMDYAAYLLKIKRSVKNLKWLKEKIWKERGRFNK